MPESLTAATALDALTHNIESLLNISAPETKFARNDLAVYGASLIRDNLPLVFRDPNDVNARERLCAAATIGGMQIAERPTSLPHLASFSFYGRIPHGIAAAMLLPPFWRYYLGKKAVAERTMLLAEVFPGKTPEEIVDAVAAFIAEYAGVSSLSALPCFDAAMVDKIASDAGKNPMKLASAPRPVALENAAGIISGILKKEL